MSPATSPANYRRQRRERSPLERALGVGLIFGVIAVYIAVVGILPLIEARWIVVGVVSLGDAALITIGLGAGATVAWRRASQGFLPLALPSLVAGGIAGLLLALLAVAMQFLELRQIFISLSPALLGTLTFGLDVPLGPAILVGAGAAIGLLGAALTLAPSAIRRPVIVGLAFVLVFGVFQELIQIMMQFGELVGDLREALYTWEGLSPEGAAVIFVVAAGGAALWTTTLRRRVETLFARLTPSQQGYARAAKVILGVLLLVLSPAANPVSGA